MITFSRLGKYGRLGNQLFQIFTTVSHAIKNNTDYGFPEWEYNKYLKTPLPIFSGQGIREFKERGPFIFCDIPNFKDLDLVGYFQNERYFKDNKEKIFKILELKEDVNSIILKEKQKWGEGRKTSIHVRRGDYLKLSDHHPVLNIEYYKKTTDLLYNETEKFIVFSDDMEWCKNNFNYSDKFYFQENNSDFIDMFLISKCDNHIIANSSFSWWGSYLSENKGKCFVPSIWLGPSYKGTDYSGIYRSEMIKI